MATATFVEQLYKIFLYRNSDVEGSNYWIDAIDSQRLNASEVTQSLVESDEFTQSVTPIAKLYYTTFGRIPDAEGLLYWTQAYKNGSAIEKITDSFVNSIEFEGLYGEVADNSLFLESLYQNVFNRVSDDAGVSYWLNAMGKGLTPSQVINSFAYSAEFNQGKSEDIKVLLTYHGILGTQPTQSEIDTATTDANPTQLITQLYANNNYTGEMVPFLSNDGVVIDGYVRDATVFIDADNDGIQDEGEASVVTDEFGNFDFGDEAGFGSLVMSGGIDISTNLAFEGTFTAPAGAQTVSPLSSLVDKVMQNSGITAAKAATVVANALGLSSTIDLLTFDPIAAASARGASTEEKDAAVDAQAAAVKVANMMSQAAAMLDGAGITTEQEGANYAVLALADMIVKASVTSTPFVDLSSAATVQNFLQTSATQGEVTQAQSTAVAAVSRDIATATANINISMSNAVTNAAPDATPAEIFTSLAQNQVAAEGIENMVEAGTTGGNARTAAAETADDKFAAAVADSADEMAAASSAANGSPGPTPGPAPIRDITAPVLTRATVNESSLVLTYNEALDAINTPLTDAFTVKVNDTPLVAPTDITVDSTAKTVTLTLATPVTSGQAVHLSYIDPTTGDDTAAIQDAAGNDAIALTDQVVTNHTTDLSGIATTSEIMTFASSNQNMWGNFDGYIGWHEYIPFLGDAPKTWDATTAEWNDDPDAAYWSSGQFDVADVTVDSAEIIAAASAGSVAVLDAAKEVFDIASVVVDTVALAAFNEAKTIFALAEVAFYFGARTVDDAVRATFMQAQNDYALAKVIYDQASYDFNTLAQVAFDIFRIPFEALEDTFNSAYSTWVTEDQQMVDSQWGTAFGLPLYDPIQAAEATAAWAVQAAARTALETERLKYNGALWLYNEAKALWDDAVNEFDGIVTGVYNAALASYEAAASVVDTAAELIFTKAKAELAAAEGLYNDAKLLVSEGALEVYNVTRDGVLNTLKTVSDTVSYDSTMKVAAEIFAQVGLQVDFELDMGSVDTSIDYRLTSATQYNGTTDMLVITPTMTNITTGDSVIFDTISPNAKFYAAILYDVGADFEVFIDSKLAVKGETLFDLSPLTDGLNIPMTVSTEDFADILGAGSAGNIDFGTLVLADLDSTQLEPFQIPFVEELTKNILTIDVAIPTLETEGTAAVYDSETYKEGALLNIDFSEISSTFFNMLNARIDFSDEFMDQYGLTSLGDKTIDQIVTSVGEGLLANLWNVIGGQSEGVPIFVIDTTDETSSSLLHLNLFPDSVMTDTVSADTGSLGFYGAYGESDPVVQFTVDVDAAYALIVNEIVKAGVAVATGGTTAAIDDAFPVINPYNLEFGIEQILKIAQVPTTEAEKITDWVNLGFSFEAADLDVTSGANFSQEFTLSIDDMSYRVTLEDGTFSEFTANDSGALLIENASSHDTNNDNIIDYSLSIVPTAMFSNDTEIGLNLGYTLDFLQGGFAAGVKLPLDELLGIENADWLNLDFSAIDISMGPLLRVEGDLDALDVDIFESRFALDVGTDSYDGSVPLVGIEDSIPEVIV